MSQPFASGKNAQGTCDRCAQVYQLLELKKEIYNQKPTGFLVCDDCWDLDHPQLQLGRFPINDPQALRNPRVDTHKIESRELWGWNPVGNPSTQLFARVGDVKVNGTFNEPNRQVNP